MYAGAVELMRSTAEVSRVIEVQNGEDLEGIEKRLGGGEEWWSNPWRETREEGRQEYLPALDATNKVDVQRAMEVDSGCDVSCTGLSIDRSLRESEVWLWSWVFKAQRLPKHIPRLRPIGNTCLYAERWLSEVIPDPPKLLRSTLHRCHCNTNVVSKPWWGKVTTHFLWYSPVCSIHTCICFTVTHQLLILTLVVPPMTDFVVKLLSHKKVLNNKYLQPPKPKI